MQTSGAGERLFQRHVAATEGPQVPRRGRVDTWGGDEARPGPIRLQVGLDSVGRGLRCCGDVFPAGEELCLGGVRAPGIRRFNIGNLLSFAANCESDPQARKRQEAQHWVVRLEGGEQLGRASCQYRSRSSLALREVNEVVGPVVDDASWVVDILVNQPGTEVANLARADVHL